MYCHVWFVTKYRRPILEREIEKKVKSYLEEVATCKKYNILELETDRDHMHILVEAKDRKELSTILRTLKCVSSKKILKILRLGVGKVGRVRRSFWGRRYGCREIGFAELENIRKYIRNQKNLHALRS